MGSERLASHPLASGFYTVSEAAKLIAVGNEQRIRGWLKGYPRRHVGPLLVRDFEPINKKEELSFLDLMEVRFVEHFREAGVKANTLRQVAQRLRTEFKLPHPFANERVVLVADKSDVFVEDVLKDSAKEHEDKRLLSLLTSNYVMYEAIKRSLIPGLRFDPSTRLIRSWKPRPDQFPIIRIDPKIAYGQPSVPEGIPTATLYESWLAEDEDYDAVAYWYELSSPTVKQAIEFEKALVTRH
jgi:uncharacterized protein (DUF433 family)